MRTWCIAALALLTGGLTSAADPTAGLKIGMVSGMFRDVDPDIVQALAKPFRDLMQKQTGLSGEVEIVDDAMTLAEKLKGNSLNIGVFHGFEFAWAKDYCDDILPIVTTKPPGGKVQAMLVVNADLGLRTIDDMKSLELLVPRGAKAHSLAYLAKLQAKHSKNFPKVVVNVKLTSDEALSQVAAGLIPGALVDMGALAGYRLLQPGASRNLLVLEESEEFPPAVVAYRRGQLSDADVQRIRRGLTTASKTPSGRILMTLWNLKGFAEPDETYVKSTEEILKIYPAPVPAKRQGGDAILTTKPKGEK